MNTKAGIRGPKDLEGRKVGVNRGYTVTTGVWARGILQQEYGVDLSKITWVLSGDEHVAEYQAPPNVVPIEKGRKMADMLASGELAAAIGVEVDHPDVKPLIPNGAGSGPRGAAEPRHYPINHTVVIRDELLGRASGPRRRRVQHLRRVEAPVCRAPEGRAGSRSRPTSTGCTSA